MQKHNCLSEVCHLSVSAFTYFFSQLIIDSLEMIFYSSLFFFIEVFGCFLWKKKTYDALTLHFFLEGTFDWSLISQASPQWMDPRVDLSQVLSISRSALLSPIRGLHVWGKNAHRARCKKCFLRIHYLRKKKGQTIEICFTTALVQWLYHIKPQYESWNKIFQFEWIYNYISQFFTVFY